MHIESPALARQIAERVRPRCEQFYGLYAILQDDWQAISPLLATVPNDETPIAQTSADFPITFTGAHFHAFAGLVQSSLYVANNAALLAVIRGFCVRALDQCILTVPQTAQTNVSDPALRVVLQRIRPRAVFYRRLRYLLNDDLRVLNAVVDPAWSDADTIEEYRSDVGGKTIGELRAFMALESASVSPDVNTESVASAIDAAAGCPLEVR